MGCKKNCKIFVSELGFKSGIMRGFQKGITLWGRTSANSYLLGLQKICKIFASELGFKLGIMRGFQKGITLGGRTSADFYLMGLQNRVAKKFAKFLHLSVDISRGS